MPGVKVGDLAIIRGLSSWAPELVKLNGRIVEVLQRTPLSPFTMPDGVHSSGGDPREWSWIIRYVGGPGVSQLNRSGRFGASDYALVYDRNLFPLPGDDTGERDQSPEEVPRDLKGTVHRKDVSEAAARSVTRASFGVPIFSHREDAL